MKKGTLIVSLLVSLLAMPCALFSQGKSEKNATGVNSAAPVTELQLWHRWSGTNEEKLNQIVALFEEANPDVKVTVTSKPGEYMELLQKMIANLAAGKNPPDLFVGGYNLLNYIGSELKPNEVGTLAPSSDSYQVFVDRFDPAIWALGNMDARQIGVPFALSNIVLFYNADLFRQAGLTESDVPSTWDDVFRIGKFIKEKTGKYAVGIQSVDTWPDLGLMFSNGGRLLTDDNSKVAFNNPESEEAIAMWQRLHNEGLHPICTDDELYADFVAGNVAMYDSSCMKLAGMQKAANFDLEVAKTPAFGLKPRALPAGGAAIINFSKDKARKDASWRFIEFATSQKAMEIFSQSGYLCVTKDKVPVNKGQEAAYSQIPNAVPWICWPGGSIGLEMERRYHDVRMQIIQENVDTKEAFDKLVPELNALLK